MNHILCYIYCLIQKYIFRSDFLDDRIIEDIFYICKTKNKRIKLYESIILTHPLYAYLYARDLIKDRWIEAEPVILTDANYCCYYSLMVIKGRWIDAERIIYTNAYASFLYSINILQERWYEAEPFIKNNSLVWLDYSKFFNIKQEYKWKLGL